MSTPVIVASDSGARLGSLTPPNSVVAEDVSSIIDDVIDKAFELVRSAQDAVPATLEEETAHMRRRLFRTLDHPDRRIIAIDCASVSVDQIQNASDLFLNDPSLRERHNLVLAVPTDPSFADSPASGWVESLKQRAFENGLDGQVSWLLIHQPDSELTALQNLVQEQGGQWYAA